MTKESTLLDLIVTDKIRKNRAFHKYRAEAVTVDSYMKMYEGPQHMGMSNKFFKDLYHLCKDFVEGNTAVAQSEVQPQTPSAPVAVSQPKPAPKYSWEDFLAQKEKLVPYGDLQDEEIGTWLNKAVEQTLRYNLEHPGKKADQKAAEALRMYYVEGRTVEDIAAELGVNKESVQGNYLRKFFRGDKAIGGCKVSPAFIKVLRDTTEQCLYQTVSSFYTEHAIVKECQQNFFVHASGCEVLETQKDWGDCEVMIRKTDSKINCKQTLHVLKEVINATVVPVPMEQIKKAFKAHWESKKYDSKLNYQPVEKIIEPFLESHEWVLENDNAEYYLDELFLSVDAARVGRILYEDGSFMKSSQIIERYQQLYHKDYKGLLLPKGLAETGLFFTLDKEHYYSEVGKKLDSIKAFIKRYADDKKQFNFNDLLAELKKIKQNLNEASIRAYVMDICRSALADKNVLVHKDYVDQYPNIQWRKEQNMDRANWTINTAIAILAKHGDSMERKTFNTQLLKEGKSCGYNASILEVVYQRFGRSLAEPLFVISDDTIKVDRKVLADNYHNDLDNIGYKNKYFDVYYNIYAQTITQLRKLQKSEMLLTDIYEMVRPTLPDDVNYLNVRSAFEKKRLPKQLDRENRDNHVFIILKKDVDEAEAKQETQYTVAAEADKDNDEQPALSASTEMREVVSADTKLDYQKLASAISKNLVFYERWYADITSQAVIDKFLTFLQESANGMLSTVFPQKLYEYFHCQIDRNNITDYLLYACIDFEALLKEIISENHPGERFGGMNDICMHYYPEYADAIRYNARRGFGGILNDLNAFRNKIVHGGDNTLDMLTLHHKFVSYVALYIYTVAKYSD